jgi:hypothetical protein
VRDPEHVKGLDRGRDLVPYQAAQDLEQIKETNHSTTLSEFQPDSKAHSQTTNKRNKKRYHMKEKHCV